MSSVKSLHLGFEKLNRSSHHTWRIWRHHRRPALTADEGIIHWRNADLTFVTVRDVTSDFVIVICSIIDSGWRMHFSCGCLIFQKKTVNRLTGSNGIHLFNTAARLIHSERFNFFFPRCCLHCCPYHYINKIQVLFILKMEYKLLLKTIKSNFFKLLK